MKSVHFVIIVTVWVLFYGILCYMDYLDRKRESPVSCTCTKGIQFIRWHEKRAVFLDRFMYPSHQLTEQEIINLQDSIQYYTNLIQTK